MLRLSTEMTTCYSTWGHRTPAPIGDFFGEQTARVADKTKISRTNPLKGDAIVFVHFITRLSCATKHMRDPKDSSKKFPHIALRNKNEPFALHVRQHAVFFAEINIRSSRRRYPLTENQDGGGLNLSILARGVQLATEIKKSLSKHEQEEKNIDRPRVAMGCRFPSTDLPHLLNRSCRNSSATPTLPSPPPDLQLESCVPSPPAPGSLPPPTPIKDSAQADGEEGMARSKCLRGSPLKWRTCLISEGNSLLADSL